MINSNYLQNWFKGGNTFALYEDCNSSFRELALAKKRNDINSMLFWEKSIQVKTEVTNIIFKWFYIRENKINTQDDFDDFMNCCKRLIEIKFKSKWADICTGAYTKKIITK